MDKISIRHIHLGFRRSRSSPGDKYMLQGIKTLEQGQWILPTWWLKIIDTVF